MLLRKWIYEIRVVKFISLFFAKDRQGLFSINSQTKISRKAQEYVGITPLSFQIVLLMATRWRDQSSILNGITKSNSLSPYDPASMTKSTHEFVCKPDIEERHAPQQTTCRIDTALCVDVSWGEWIGRLALSMLRQKQNLESRSTIHNTKKRTTQTKENSQHEHI